MIPIMTTRDRDALRSRMFEQCRGPSGYAGPRHPTTGCSFPDGRSSPDGGIGFVNGEFVQQRPPRPQKVCECRERWRIACALGDGGFGTGIVEQWRFIRTDDDAPIYVVGPRGKRIDVHDPEKLREYLDGPRDADPKDAGPRDAFDHAIGLFVCGAGTGIGKTVVGTLAVAELLRWGRDQGRIPISYRGCRFMNTIEFHDLAWRGRDAFHDVVHGDADFPEDESVDAWSVDLFMLDEIGREASSSEKTLRGREAQEMFLRHRQTIRRPTIVCGAMSSRQQVGDKLGAQTASLLRDTTVEVQVIGDDLRG